MVSEAPAFAPVFHYDEPLCTQFLSSLFLDRDRFLEEIKEQEAFHGPQVESLPVLQVIEF